MFQSSKQKIKIGYKIEIQKLHNVVVCFKQKSSPLYTLVENVLKRISKIFTGRVVV